LFAALFTILIYNCENEVSVFENEPNYIPVEAQSSFLFDEIYNPRTIQFIDGKFYVAESQNPDASFHVKY